MCELSPVTFHGDTIFCVTLENQPYTPAKPIVENLGLGWASQSQKLNANKERWGVTIIVIPSESGEQQTLCLPVRKLPAFLASINPKKVKPELRERIELYQAECDDALWDYWMHGRAASSRPLADDMVLPTSDRTSRRTDPERKQLTAIINTWVSMAPIHYASARAQVNAHFGVASVDALTVAQVREAVAWVQAKIDALPPVPERMALPAPEKDKFEAYIEQVEAFRARTNSEIRRLLKEGLLLVDIYKFGPEVIEGFSSIFHSWLREVAGSPSPLVASYWSMGRAIECSPLCLVREMEKILPRYQFK